MYNSILQLAAQLTEKICERAESGEIRDLDVMTEEVLKGSLRTDHSGDHPVIQRRDPKR